MTYSIESKTVSIFIFSILELIDYMFKISTDAASNWVIVVNFIVLLLLFVFKHNKLFHEVILVWFSLMFLNYLMAFLPQVDRVYGYNYIFSMLGALIKLFFLCLIIFYCLKSGKKLSCE